MKSIEFYDAQKQFKESYSAADVVKKYGKSLVGKRVMTQAVGEWPGGEAIVTKVRHDKNAPEIVCLVRSCNAKVNKQFGEMGCFHDEQMEVLE